MMHNSVLPMASEHRWSGVATDVLALVLIGLVGWNFTFGSEKTVDVSLYDETAYLQRGVEGWVGGSDDASWGTLYSGWYRVLSPIAPDSLKLFYINYKALTVLPALLLYLLVRSCRTSAWIALVFACLFMTSASDSPVWPKVGHLALCIMLGGMWLCSLSRNTAIGLGIVCIGSLVAAYIRPELFVAYIMQGAALLLLMVSANDVQERRKRGMILTVVVVAGVACMACCGVPLSGKRTWMAFGQHFGLNWCRWMPCELDAWTDWVAITERAFGHVTGLREAFNSAPTLVLKHMVANGLQAPSMLSALMLKPAVEFGGDLRWSRFHAVYLILQMACLWALVPLCGCRQACANIKENIARHRTLGFVMSTYVLVSLASILVIYPRPHYIVLPGLLIGTFMMIVLGGNRSRRSLSVEQEVLLMMGVGLVFVFATPSTVEGLPRPNVATIAEIKNIPVTKHVHLLEAEGGIATYLGAEFTWVRSYRKDCPFDEFRAREHIDMILLSDRLMADSRFRDDPQWAMFMANASAKGFTSVDINGADRKLLVQTALLTESSCSAEARSRDPVIKRFH